MVIGHVTITSQSTKLILRLHRALSQDNGSQVSPQPLVIRQ